MDKLGKIRQLRWKECLSVSKIAKFESDLLKTNEDRAPQSRLILQTFEWWAPPFKHLNFRIFSELYVHWLKGTSL